jgi:hypothetical protein
MIKSNNYTILFALIYNTHVVCYNTGFNYISST